MEKEKKVVKKAVKTEKTANAQPKQTAKVAKKVAPAKVEKAELAQSQVEVNAVTQAKAEKKSIMHNKELNLIIGLFSLITIISFSFAFQGGDVEVLGWELFLKSGAYSGVFKGLMIIFIISVFIDCILAIRIDGENEIINIVEKALYMFTLVINVVVLAVLMSLIVEIGLGLIIFLIISIMSIIVKLARIYSKSK